MIGTMVKQLTEKRASRSWKGRTRRIFYRSRQSRLSRQRFGNSLTAAYLQSKGDPITDLYEDMAAEQKARSTYEYLIQLADDPDVIDPLRFLREREVVHFQRFGEALRLVQDYLGDRKRVSMRMPDKKR